MNDATVMYLSRGSIPVTLDNLQTSLLYTEKESQWKLLSVNCGLYRVKGVMNGYLKTKLAFLLFGWTKPLLIQTVNRWKRSTECIFKWNLAWLYADGFVQDRPTSKVINHFCSFPAFLRHPLCQSHIRTPMHPTRTFSPLLSFITSSFTVRKQTYTQGVTE